MNALQFNLEGVREILPIISKYLNLKFKINNCKFYILFRKTHLRNKYYYNKNNPMLKCFY